MKSKMIECVIGAACALMAVSSVQAADVDVFVGRRGGVNVEIGNGRGGASIEFGGRHGEYRGEREFRHGRNFDRGDRYRGDRGGRGDWGGGRGGWDRHERRHRRHDRHWHRDWHPRSGWNHNWVWRRSHRPHWVYSGFAWPSWYWINAPRGYWQCTAFDQYTDAYSEIGRTEDQAAYNALVACGDFSECYIPPGYCQFRR